MDGSRWYPDEDGDGYGDTTRDAVVLRCPAPDPEGRAWVPDLEYDYVYCSDALCDCDDSDAAIHPFAPEVWYDGVDQDCDGASDNDADGDDVDDAAHGGTDCDDMDSNTSPEAPELCDGDDDDCDGAIDGPPCGTTAGREDARVLTCSTRWESYTLDNVGDTDGDGADELLSVTLNAGTFVLSAFDTGSVHTAASAVIAGDGLVVGGPLGDLDGDGLADVWAHDLREDDLTPAFILPGPLRGTRALEDEAWLLGARTATAAGDLDDDGADDLVVDGCVVFGPVERGTTVTNSCGGTLPSIFPIVPGGDLDGDGMADLVVVGDTAYYEPIYVLHGPFDTDRGFDTAAGSWGEGEGPGWQFSWIASALGDVDGDGLDDLAIGTPSYDREERSIGSAYVVLGPADGAHGLADAWALMRGDPTGHNLGRSVVGPGDLDGDGRADLVVSGDVQDGVDHEGSTWVITGLASGTWIAGTRSVRWTGASWLGAALAAGDLDGDGEHEVALGVTEYDESGGDALWIVR